MPAKWQQWMPFKIDAFKSSPAVRAMHPAARSGYLYLLTFAWQTDDCTIPSDPIELAEISEIGDELWAVHGPRILRKFDQVEGTDRFRNSTVFEEWKEAKRVFDARRDAADRTNQSRSPHGHRTVTARGPSRSAHTRTGTETGTVTEIQKTQIAALPEWLNAELWNSWVEMRKKVRNAPFTDHARQGILKDLGQLRDWGIDPHQRLEQAIRKGWRGVLFDSDKPTLPLEKPKTRYEESVERQAEEQREARRQAGLLQ